MRAGARRLVTRLHGAGDPVVAQHDWFADALVRAGVAGVESAGVPVVTRGGRVDASGEGSRLVPLDEELAAEFEDRGTSFVVRSTVDELEQDLDQSLDRERFERDLGRDEIDRDYGPER